MRNTAICCTCALWLESQFFYVISATFMTMFLYHTHFFSSFIRLIITLYLISINYSEKDDIPVTSYPAVRRQSQLNEEHVSPLTHAVYALTWYVIDADSHLKVHNCFSTSGLLHGMRSFVDIWRKSTAIQNPISLSPSDSSLSLTPITTSISHSHNLSHSHTRSLSLSLGFL